MDQLAKEEVAERGKILKQFWVAIRIASIQHERPVSSLVDRAWNGRLRVGSRLSEISWHGRDRNAMLSPQLLELLRIWWREGKRRGVMFPNGWLFPGRSYTDPVSARQLHRAVQEAAEVAGIKRRISPHTLRHSPPCPCCGGCMIVIEAISRWRQPRAPPVPVIPIRELAP